MKFRTPFFWQPSADVLKILQSNTPGKFFVIAMNYLIWFFLFYVSYLLIKSDTNVFWQLFIATLVGEFVEKYGKSHALWPRPLYKRKDPTPFGLVDHWYQTGSFPSGHTIKATFFLLFLLQYPVFPVTTYILIVVPLLVFRVIVGFHYPIDMFGGAFVGLFIWLSSRSIFLPESLTNFVRIIFNFIFRV